jgi:hypothetical protein
MKRLHDVAVRMRPRVPRRPDGAPGNAPMGDSPQAETRGPADAGRILQAGDGRASRRAAPSCRPRATWPGRPPMTADRFRSTSTPRPRQSWPTRTGRPHTKPISGPTPMTSKHPRADRPDFGAAAPDLGPRARRNRGCGLPFRRHRPHLSARCRRAGGRPMPKMRKPTPTALAPMTWPAARCARCRRPKGNWRHAVSRPLRSTRARAPRRAFWAFTPPTGDRRDLGRGAQVRGRRAFPRRLDRRGRWPGPGRLFRRDQQRLEHRARPRPVDLPEFRRRVDLAQQSCRHRL